VSTRVYLYSLYERAWHWLQAVTTIALLLTGAEMHWPGTLRLLGFSRTVSVHNVLGFVLLGNAFLALFYHLATGEIRQYLPEPRDFVTLAVKQARYYLVGIFRREPHPFQRGPHRKLNPLQEVTYLVILNVLLPLQMLSGLLMWGAQSWPDAVRAIGGLPTLAKVHTLGAWLFAAFLIAHVYLTTTGPTPLAMIRAMIVGWDESEETHATDDRPAFAEQNAG
jgi:thiosulfate reductase cytochrome b subunit